MPALMPAALGPVDSRVRLNSVGFTPGAVKQATVVASATAFRVVRIADDVAVLEGALGAETRTAAIDTDESVRTADFTALTAAGEYQLDIIGVGRSATFLVAADVWNQPLRLATRGFYLWRCGSEVSASWNGRSYQHAACHLNDGWLDYATGAHTQQDGRGGWHDAGDYNKYVVNAGVSIGLLFKTWEHHRAKFDGLALDLPETGNGTPDLLNEIRWELDWLQRMQAPDGRVYSKLSELRFGYWGVPESDTTTRYFVPWSSTATADFAAMMAMASRHFAEFDPAYAARCLVAARAAWSALVANPEYVPASQSAFSTGGYETNDAPHRLWAAAELWATTREATFLQDFEQRAASASFSDIGPTWADVHDLGLATYLETDAVDRNAALVQRLRTSVLTRAGNVVQTVATHAYGRGLGGGIWFWGVNGSVAAQTFLLHLADRMAPDPQYRRAAEVTVGYLFGRNYHNRSYVTGLGHQPPEHPHDRRGEPAWPGYLVGGGWPTGRSWQDVQANYEQNEIAINWNASLVYALAALAEPAGDQTATEWAVFTVGQSGSHQPNFNPPGTSSFTADGLPHWARIDPLTGAISGTPADDPATPEYNARKIHVVTLSAFRGAQRLGTRGINLMVAEAGRGVRIANLSARGAVSAGENVLMAGFVASGSTPRTLLLRGVGPSLVNLGVTGFLADPTITLFSTQGQLLANDEWHTTAAAGNIRTFGSAVGAFPLIDPSHDAALLPTVVPTRYTMHVAGAGNAAGVALVEIYDGNSATSDGQLVNISARARVGVGDDVLIAGTVLAGGGSARILVRAVGPTLASQGVVVPLADPVLTVLSRQTVLARNDDWGSSEPNAIAAAAVSVGAFALPAGSRDAAVIATLVDGAFTVVVEGKTGAGGVALVELYLLP